MNEKQLDEKVSKDAANVKKEIGTLVEDSAARLGKLEEKVSQATGKAKDDATTWVEDSASKLSKGFDKLSGDAKDTLADAAKMVKKDFGHRLSQYNAKAQDLAGNFPDSFTKKVTRYPWVAISIVLAAGFLIGFLFRPIQQPLEQI